MNTAVHLLAVFVWHTCKPQVATWTALSIEVQPVEHFCGPNWRPLCTGHVHRPPPVGKTHIKCNITIVPEQKSNGFYKK